MAETGATRRETARALGIHLCTLTRLAKRHGIVFRDARKITPRAHPRSERWRALFEQGLTAHEAAVAMGTTVRAAYEAARRGGYRFRAPDRDETLRRCIAELIAQGCWLREAARRLRRSMRTVARVAQRNGLSFPRRPTAARTTAPRTTAPRAPDPVDALTPDERADWRLFRSKGFSRAEALRIVLDDRARRNRGGA